MTVLIGRILQRAAELSPRSIAATLDEASVTFADVDGGANRVAHVMSGHGVGPDDRIASWTDISLRSLDVFFAAARLGAAFAPLNPALSFSEAREVITYLRPRLFVTDAAHLEQAAQIAGELDVPLFVTGATGKTTAGLDLDAETERASRGAPDQPEPTPDRAHVIFLTSGSTGRPKGVVLSHYASWMRAVPLGGATRLVAPGGGGDLCPFPLFHMAGWNAVLCAWALLRPIHLVSQPTGERLLAPGRALAPVDPLLHTRVVASHVRQHDVALTRPFEPALRHHGHLVGERRPPARDQGPVTRHRDHHQLRLDGNGHRHHPRRSRSLSQERQHRTTESGLRRRHHRRRALSLG